MVWFLALSLSFVTGTTLSDTVSTFTGSLTIDQDTNAVALNIDSEANLPTIYVKSANDGSAGTYQNKFAQYINPEGIGGGQVIYRNVAGALNPLSDVYEDGAATTTVSRIYNDGTGNGLFIDQNGNGIGLNIDSEATTAGGVVVDADALTTAPAIYANSNSATFSGNGYHGSGGLVTGYVQHASATGNAISAIQYGTGNAITALNTGTGSGLFIDQNGDGYGMYIDSEATTGSKYGLIVETAQGANAARFTSDTSSYSIISLDPSQARSNWFFRDLGSADTNGAVALFEQDNVGDDQPVVQIQQDGANMHIEMIGTNTATCDDTTSGIFANSTGIFACFGGTATVLAE